MNSEKLKKQNPAEQPSFLCELQELLTVPQGSTDFRANMTG